METKLLRKRFLAWVLILGVIAWLPVTTVFASDLSAAQYFGIITISNNSTATGNVSAVLTLSSADLISQGWVDSDFDNCAIRNTSGADVVFGPSVNASYPWCLWVPSIGANTNINYTLYTGNDSLSSTKYWFPGSGGMAVEDVATLELDNYFTILWEARLNTANGTSKSLVDKPDAFSCNFSDTVSGNITATIYAWTDSETLAPDGAGSETNIDSVSGAATHWQACLTNDGDTSYVYNDQVGSYQRDLYSAGYATKSGPISSVVVTVVARYDGASGVYAKTSVKTNGTVYDGSANALTGSYASYSTTYTTNPQTGVAWTQTEVNAIEIGASLIAVGGTTTRCTQVYATINYSYPTASVSATGISSGNTLQVSAIPEQVNVSEDFEWGSDGDNISTSGGTVTWAVVAAGSSRAEIDESQYYEGTRSGRFYRDGTNHPSALFTQTAISNIGCIAFRVRKDDTSSCYFYHGNGTRRINVVIAADEKVCYFDGVLKETGSSISINTWYLLEVRNLDWTAGTYDIWLGGSLIKSGATMHTTAGYGNQICFLNASGTSECWIDNVQVKTDEYLGIWVDGGLKDNDYLAGARVPDNSSNLTFCSGGCVFYVESVSVNVSGVNSGYWEWEYSTTFTDQSGNGNTATPTFRTASSDPDVSCTLVSFQPIQTAKAPAYTVEEAPDFITANITVSGNFTGATVPAGGPPGASLVEGVADAGGTPRIWLWGILAGVVTVSAGLFVSYMERKHGGGGGTLLLRIGIGAAVFGVMIAFGKFDWWMLVLYLFIVLAPAMASRHGEWGGSVGQLNLIGFLAMSWVGLTMINRILEGQFITTAERSFINTLMFTQEFQLFGIFKVPVMNFQFFTQGIPMLLKWDYSFFGGNAQIFQYLLYSLTAVMSLIVFGFIIGLLYNYFSRLR